MKRRFINFSIVFTSTIFALCLAEVLVRVFYPQNLIYFNDKVWRPDQTFGWRHQENTNVLINNGQGEVSFITDSNGYRVGEDTMFDRSNGILALGDSFLEAVQVDNDSCFTDMLEKRLNLAEGMNTRIYNAGVAGWSPNHYLLESQRVINDTELKIDRALVFLYLGNDIVPRKVDRFVSNDRIQNRAFRFPKSLSRSEFVYGVLFPLGDFLDRNSQLHILVKRKNYRLLARLGLTSHSISPSFLTKYRESESWEVTVDICESINQQFDQEGIPVSFVFIPTVYQVNEEVLNEYLEDFKISQDSIDIEQPNKALGQLMKSRSLDFHDPLTFLRSKNDQGISLYGRLDPHFNASGHQAMSDYLFQVFGSSLLKEPEDRQN